ncbi:MAG: type II secretion system protein [Clostridia bacterium]|nr:type II secretion system protein [Clostridia bacterium]
MRIIKEGEVKTYENKRSKQGVSLIVLVITIIVMIILAGTIILSLNNSGIIDKAQEAVDKTNEAQLKQIVQVGWAEAYASGARTEEELKAGVDAVIEKNKLDVSNYDIVVTTSGVTVTRKGTITGWRQEGLTVTNGTQTLQIGDSIEYDETNDGTITGLTATDWKVLGASVDGELLIMSTNDVESNYILGGDEDLEESQNDWLTGGEELNEICRPYGQGKGAISARSIEVEDIKKIGEYDPSGDGKGNLYEYGNEVIYSYNGTTNPAYAGSNGVSGELLDQHSNGFHYHNGEEFLVIDDLTTGVIGQTFVILKNDYYSPGAGVDEDSKVLDMIFGEEGTDYREASYWLASSSLYSVPRYVVYVMHCVSHGGTTEQHLWQSTGEATLGVYGVRAVVSLSPDIQLSGSSETGWTF